MEFNFLGFVTAVLGSGALGGGVVWLYNKIKQVGVADVENRQYRDAVDTLLQRQDIQDEKLQELDGKYTNIKQDLDLRLTKMELEIIHIREMQAQHNRALSETSKDVKNLLGRGG